MGAKCCTDRKPRPEGWEEKGIAEQMTSSLKSAWAEGINGESLFVVHLDNKHEDKDGDGEISAKEKSVGFSVDTETLRIKAVVPGGLLDKYCAQNDETVCPGDKIFSVNDYTDSADIIKEIKENERLEIWFAKMIWEVELAKKPGKKLGASTDPKSFAILKVDPDSLVGDWNKDHPEEQIQVGDKVLSVNGIADLQKAMQEIVSSDVLKLWRHCVSSEAPKEQKQKQKESLQCQRLQYQRQKQKPTLSLQELGHYPHNSCSSSKRSMTLTVTSLCLTQSSKTLQRRLPSYKGNLHSRTRICRRYSKSLTRTTVES
eukprot:TRINITY_DN20977_c0_g1_i4.p1 TRINITY_DN20977_c0_g1~~TRINITY_DN20977_c0_g1_i4.p1  ORF type:complete len:315 (+),score=74.25 TRINITY_DN20977_c0_g1_i4:126-1070(+)